MTVTRTHTYPAGTAPGVYTITATDGVNSAQAQITILDPTANTVVLNPNSLAAGASVTVTGEGYPATTSGTLTITPTAGGDPIIDQDITTNADGDIPSTVVQIPIDTPAGTYTVMFTVDAEFGSSTLTVTAPVQLAAPTGLTPGLVTDTTIPLTWSAVTNANQYRVEYKLATSGTWLQRPAVATTSDTITGLTAGQQYDLRVVALDTTGVYADSPPSAEAEATTTGGTPPQLAAPTGVAASTVTGTSVALVWDENADAVGYVVRWRADGTTPWTTRTQVTTETDTVPALTAGTLYEFQVQAAGDGTTFSSSDFGPEPPLEVRAADPMATPANFFAEAATTTTAGVSWDAVSGATAYRVEYKLDAASTWTAWSPDPTGTSTTVTGLTAGQIYDLRVKTLGNGTTTSDSPYTTDETVNLVELAAPTGLASPSQTATSVSLTWTAVTNATSYAVEWSPAGAGTWTEVFAASNSSTVSGLTTATSYDFRVTARADAWVDSPWSTVLTQSTT